jgi:hypothetical protein
LLGTVLPSIVAIKSQLGCKSATGGGHGEGAVNVVSTSAGSVGNPTDAGLLSPYSSIIS